MFIVTEYAALYDLLSRKKRNRKEIKTINLNGNLYNTGIMLYKRHTMMFKRYISANEIIEF